MSDHSVLHLSIVVPVYNEVDNVSPLVSDIIEEVSKLDKAFELIVVNDGSSDGTGHTLDTIAAGDPRLKVIHFVHNFGQTSAMAAGLEAACGRIIITMDGDRQNDPADIGEMLKFLDGGFDLVSGWRRDRKDNALRRLPSVMANWLIGWATGVHLHDYGCTLKAYRAGFLNPDDLYGETHRFLPVFVADRGGRIAEMVVRHHPRTAGVAKYGLNRTLRVISDLLLVSLLFKFRSRPSHLFVKIAQYPGALAILCLLLGAWQWLFSEGHVLFNGRTLAGLILGTGSLVLAGMGLCSELIMRTRYESTHRRPWQIARKVNFDSGPQPVEPVPTESVDR